MEGGPRRGSAGEAGRGAGAPLMNRVGPGTDCQPAAISLCHGSGLLATAASPAARSSASLRGLNSTRRSPARRSHTKGAGAASERGGRAGTRGGGAAAGKTASRQDAGCRGPDTSWKLLEMAPATAPEGAANLGRALAPARLLSRARMQGPGGAVPALRGWLGLKKFLHGSFVSPVRGIAGPELPQSSRVSERYCLLLVLPF